MSIRVTHIEQGTGDHISLVSVDDVIKYLSSNPDPATVDQLYDFGKLLLDQIRSLRESHNAKLTACLGWGSALLAVVLVGAKEWISDGIPGYLAVFGTALAVACVLSSTIGLRSAGGWAWPSERDWFSVDYLRWPERLKIQHLIAMLEAHQSYSRKTQKKGYLLDLSEKLLAASGVLLGAAAVVRQLQLL
jgi:hypothetical protein